MIESGEPWTFDYYDQVAKRKGYRFPGVIVSRFHTMSGAARYVVECTVPEVKGALHIYSSADLRKRRARPEGKP